MTRIILVEDDRLFARILQSSLIQNSYRVDWFETEAIAIQAIAETHYDLGIFDVSLYRTSGLDLVRKLRSAGNHLPVLMLSTFCRSQDRTEGLDSGADDYLAKPFDMAEFQARIRALLRRQRHAVDEPLRSGDVELHTDAMIVRRNDRIIRLTLKEFLTLRILMERSGRYVSKADIEYAIYDVDTLVESNAIEVTIYTLRKKLGSDFIRSIRGVGYTVERTGAERTRDVCDHHRSRIA
ncbi:response regulator transcription factor [Rhizobium oryzicola]|uniref:Response regulator transcription factor n=1 Tax=Rhizobium oryzicola TaxID=1232668 RepID=A0ABT8T2E7_9HYPH|nr:response regulator transcription factor [Rhizobium oryzicola]MDO1584897.1 response regulator transcription factor [Rhizobium oryzicola]